MSKASSSKNTKNIINNNYKDVAKPNVTKQISCKTNKNKRCIYIYILPQNYMNRDITAKKNEKEYKAAWLYEDSMLDDILPIL